MKVVERKREVRIQSSVRFIRLVFRQGNINHRCLHALTCSPITLITKIFMASFFPCFFLFMLWPSKRRAQARNYGSIGPGELKFHEFSKRTIRIPAEFFVGSLFGDLSVRRKDNDGVGAFDGREAMCDGDGRVIIAF